LRGSYCLLFGSIL